LQLFELIAKAASLDGSARRVGFGEEEEHDRLAPKLLQTDGLAVLIWNSNIGSFITNFHEA
jgi:hypothetical protein